MVLVPKGYHGTRVPSGIMVRTRIRTIPWYHVYIGMVPLVRTPVPWYVHVYHGTSGTTMVQICHTHYSLFSSIQYLKNDYCHYKHKHSGNCTRVRTMVQVHLMPLQTQALRCNVPMVHVYVRTKITLSQKRLEIQAHRCNGETFQ